MLQSLSKTACVAAIFSAMLSFFPAEAKPASIFSKAEGTWELDPDYSQDVGDFTCDKNPIHFSIDSESELFHSSRAKESWVADILEVGESHFWIRYHNEERLDDNGVPVEWAFVLIDDNRFYWVRRDWVDRQPSGGTAPRRRCKSAKDVS